MMLKVEVISKEIIKPSYPTPSHLRTLKLSFLDQRAPPVYTPLLLFYSGDDDINTNRLKKSLSEILTHFYPLAGRINGNLFIDCNDEGVIFFEARVSGELKQVVSNHATPLELNPLLPIQNLYELGSKVVLFVQVNIFDCGGMALGVSISHKITDASSISLFLNNWAAVSRVGENKLASPNFDSASLFPPKEDMAPLPSSALFSSPTEGTSKKVIFKTYVLDASNIAALRTKCFDKNVDTDHPTRVEAVFALIWMCITNALRMRKKSDKSVFQALVAVNRRKKMVPPLSNLFFGNFVTGAMVTSTVESNSQLHFLASQFHELFRKIDGHTVGIPRFQGNLKEQEFFCLNSWCRFPFYGTDFGWGEPIWITSPSEMAKNIVSLKDTKCGNGIEAMVCLDEEDMENFDCQPDLAAFTSSHQITWN